MSAWAEPSRALPLRWGGYSTRLYGGLALIVGGGMSLAGADTFQLLILLAGTTACFVGWGVLPADGWRRLTAVVPTTLCFWILLAGPKFIGVLVVPYLGWLLVRHRPALAWLTALLPIATAIVVGSVVPPGEGRMIWAIVIEVASIAAAAWVAWTIARARPPLQANPRRARASAP